MADDTDPKLTQAAQYAGLSPEMLGMLSGIPLQHAGGNVGSFADLVPQQLPPPNPADYPGVPRDTLAALASIPLQDPDKRGTGVMGTMADQLPATQLGINPSNFVGTGLSPNLIGTLASIPLQHTNGDIGTMADMAPRYTAPRWAPPRTRLIDLFGPPFRESFSGQ